MDFIKGDANGDCKLTAKDVSLMKRLIAGSITNTDVFYTNCDLNCDGKINARDISAMKRLVAGQ